HYRILQGIAIIGLLYLCYDLYSAASNWLYAAIIVAIIVIAVAASGYYLTAIAYMGHGGLILMGGFFLFRSWLGLAARNLYERWLNAFLGFFMILDNMYFAYRLIYDADYNEDYSSHVIGGIGHNDFIQMTGQMPGLTVHGIAGFTL